VRTSATAIRVTATRLKRAVVEFPDVRQLVDT
jgi:hypothetical protein